jgi:hypothetical protein
MVAVVERRRENRVRFSWPLWFGYQDNGEFFRGQIVDLSRSAVSFTIPERHCPPAGQHVLIRFSYPRHPGDEFDMDSYYFWAEVLRSYDLLPGNKRVVLRLHRPLELDPAAPAPPTQGILAQTA